jgi:hypothetical protein
VERGIGNEPKLMWKEAQEMRGGTKIDVERGTGNEPKLIGKEA